MTAASRGVEDAIIKTLGRWKSLAYLEYVKIPRDQLGVLPPGCVEYVQRQAPMLFIKSHEGISWGGGVACVSVVGLGWWSSGLPWAWIWGFPPLQSTPISTT